MKLMKKVLAVVGSVIAVSVAIRELASPRLLFVKT